MRDLISAVPWALAALLLAFAAYRESASPDVPARAAAPAAVSSHLFPAFVDAGLIH